MLAASESWPPIDAQWLGIAHQGALDAIAAREATASRRQRGVFYTPPALVRHLLDVTLRPLLDSGPLDTAPVVFDPACGCGAFLGEAARQIRAARPGLGFDRISGALMGTDIDPAAASLCRLAIWLELGGRMGPEACDHCVRVGDSLAGDVWDRGCDVVVGNPPFLSQLAANTARRPEVAKRLRERFGPSVRSYTDPAALFLQLGVESVPPGGRVGLVLPVSTLASRDAAAVRERVGAVGTLRSLWLDRDGVFDAGVRTIAIVFERGGQPGLVARSTGSAFLPEKPTDPPATSNWGPVASGLVGIPGVRPSSDVELGALADVTAGFRDEYYAIVRGLVECVREEESLGGEYLPVVPVGLIDPFVLRWGKRTSRIGGRDWKRPPVRADASGPLAAVILAQRRPKLLVATQSRVMEVAADPSGIAVALTPVVIVTPHHREDLWHVGAALSSPAISAWVGSESFGTARSLGAIKPSASLLRRVPMPTVSPAWDRAAACYRALCEQGPEESSLREFAAISNEAYGVEGSALTDWWMRRASPR
ncbi:MAG: N-6 DNA methylase [Phycisphaerales bacterium]|nr:N-6 DNA methylase [Phycisphaerales bacterium]